MKPTTFALAVLMTSAGLAQSKAPPYGAVRWDEDYPHLRDGGPHPTYARRPPLACGAAVSGSSGQACLG